MIDRKVEMVLLWKIWSMVHGRKLLLMIFETYGRLTMVYGLLTPAPHHHETVLRIAGPFHALQDSVLRSAGPFHEPHDFVLRSAGPFHEPHDFVLRSAG